MATKRILGLDLGTNSIGWALIEEETKGGKIVGLGSRIIPMDNKTKQDFEVGNPTTKNAARREARSARRLNQRYKLRRKHLMQVLQQLGWLPVFENPQALHQHLSRSAVNPEQPLLPIDLYALRDRALRECISLEELARILLHLNQRRGFLSNRKLPEPEEADGLDNDDSGSGNASKGSRRFYQRVQIASITLDDSGAKPIYTVKLTNGDVGVSYQDIPFEPQRTVELLIIEKQTKKYGLSRTFRIPDKTDWSYRKEHINKQIESSGLTVGQFYYQALKRNPHYRIKDNIVLREKYLAEFDAIWRAQCRFRQEKGQLDELERKELLPTLAKLLYENNRERQQVLIKRGLRYVFEQDIIYYQRPLKSQKDSIGFCRFEPDKRVIPISHPLFQEFRVFDLVNNLRVYDRKNNDCTAIYLSADVREELIRKLNEQQSITVTALRKMLLGGATVSGLRLSLREEQREVKGNQTLVRIAKALEDDDRADALLNDASKLELVWHILYSLSSNKDVVHALTRPKNGICVSVETAQKLARITFPSGYGSLSSRAIQRLLPLMRSGYRWTEDAFDRFPELRQKIDLLISGEVDDQLEDALREFVTANALFAPQDFQGLPYWAAASLVYGGHSKSQQNIHWQHPNQVELLPKNYLRNPIVQQIVNEALQVVKDIWVTNGKPDEIRIEFARALKNSAKSRQRIGESQLNNRKRNEAIKRRLQALGRSPADADKYRLWLESLDRNGLDQKDLAGYLQYLEPDGKRHPPAAEITRYKLWEEQLHISPYTGRPIPLSQLFGEAYQIDHIIPKQRFYDDSMSNKVVVEAQVNADKGMAGNNRTAWEYITAGPNQASLSVLDEESYVALVNRTFLKPKRDKLLMKTIPNDFVERQLKDTQFIAKAVREELAKVVGMQQVHTTTGSVTMHLREQWGIAHLFKDLLLPRFEAFETKLQEKAHKSGQAETIQLVERKFDAHFNRHLLRMKGYNKRLDHRHHAADALVVACTKPAHIKRLNDLNQLYQDQLQTGQTMRDGMTVKRKGGSWAFEKPWSHFVEDAKQALACCVVSIKNKNRLLTRSTNHYRVLDPNTGKRLERIQAKGTYGVRGPLHDAQAYGETRIRVQRTPLELALQIQKTLKNGLALEVSLSELLDQFEHAWQGQLFMQFVTKHAADFKKGVAVLRKEGLPHGQHLVQKLTMLERKYTKRVPVGALSANQLAHIANPGLRKLMQEHVVECAARNLKKPFGAEGMLVFQQKHKSPIRAVSVIYDAKQTVGQGSGKQQLLRSTSSNTKLHVDQGSNHAFAIYEQETNLRNGIWPAKREYDIRSFYEAVQLRTQGEPLFEPRQGMRFFTLAKHDLVYLPYPDEHPSQVDWENREKILPRLYNVVKFSGNELYFIPNTVAQVIRDKVEFDSPNCIQVFNGKSIKQLAIKVHCNRLGQLKPALSYD